VLFGSPVAAGDDHLGHRVGAPPPAAQRSRTAFCTVRPPGRLESR
jgi:hypothetical protein